MTKKTLFLFFVVACILRVGLLIFFKGTQIAEQYDAKEYDSIAWNLVQGNGFVNASGQPTENRPPVYPLFIAAIYAVFGHHEFMVKIFQCILDSFSVILAMLIANLMFNPFIALISGVILVFYPPLIIYSNIKLSECLFTFLLLGECLFLLKVFKTGKNINFFYAGIMQGIAVLCRSTILFFPFFLAPIIIFTQLRRKLLKGFLIYALISTAIISIWTIRNYSTFKEFIPVSANGAYLLWFAIQDDAWDGDKLVELNPLREYKDLADVPRLKWDKIITRRMMIFAVTHPLVYSRKILRNFSRLWSLPVGKVLLARKSLLLSKVYQWFHFIILGISLYGLISISRKKLLFIFPVVLFLIYLSVMHSIVISVPRYRLPFEPLLLIFFAQGILSLFNKNKKYDFSNLQIGNR